MGFFEDKLSALGRGLDACVEPIADRARAVSDRRHHARSFQAIRDKVERAKDAARDNAERGVDAARTGWSRHIRLERDQIRGLGVWAGVLIFLLAAGAGVRWYASSGPPALTDAEMKTFRQIRGGTPQNTDAAVAPGMEGWFRPAP